MEAAGKTRFSGALKADVKAQVQARRLMLKEKLKARLDKLGDARMKIKTAFAAAPEVANADCTKSKTANVEMTTSTSTSTATTTTDAGMTATVSTDVTTTTTGTL